MKTTTFGRTSENFVWTSKNLNHWPDRARRNNP